MKDDLLSIHLSIQVPLYIWEFLEKGDPTDEDFAQAGDISLLIAEKGDNILYKKKGEAARLVSKLAWGIALMAFCPGGVKAFGQHWNSEDYISHPSGDAHGQST